MSTPDPGDRTIYTSEYPISQEAAEFYGGTWSSTADDLNPPERVDIEGDIAGEATFFDRATLYRAEIAFLLFSPKIARVDDPEVLAIQLLRTKAQYFDFLKNEAHTRFGTTGYWAGGLDWEAEQPPGNQPTNVRMEVLYFDQDPDEAGGGGGESWEVPDGNLDGIIQEKLAAYNDVAVGEDVLYTEFTDLEEASLNPSGFYPHKFA
jgi:hypothetical protein